MSALTRFGPIVARSTLLQHQRHMASASSVSEPVQKLFVDKIREFKATNKGLDEAHQKAMVEEVGRLQRVYSVKDESKLASIDIKFPAEHNVSLRDLDENKELREKINSGEYQKQLSAQPAKKSELMASIPDQTRQDMHLPPMNKPSYTMMHENEGLPGPLTIADEKPDYESMKGKVTPDELEELFRVKFGAEMPTIHDDKSPQRDLVNFPRHPQRLDTPPTRYHIIPESWFRFFYPKTGVTGPYVFAASFSTFLLSKEWIIFEHELLTGITTTAIFTQAVIKFGPKLKKFIVDRLNTELDGWDHWQKGNIKSLETIIDHYNNQLTKRELLKDIYEIRKQDVELQLEGEYRARLKKVYDDTKRRLNYLVAMADSQRQIHHKNMVNWVISNAVSSIGAKQESEVLDNCIVNLKQLAVKHANAI